MSIHDQPTRRYARFVHFPTVVGVLIGLCAASGCEEKPTPPAAQPAASASGKPDGPGSVKLKKIPRTPK